MSENNKQLLIDVMSFEPVKDMLFENWRKDPNAKLIVKGIISRADSKNFNGRIYPKHVLEKALGVYSEDFIKQRRALSELDHPECFHVDTQLLTKSGWKYIKDIENNEIIMTLNMETNKPEYQQITEKVDQPYTGLMYHIKGKNIDTTVTPNHRFVVDDRYGKRQFKTAQELYDLNEKCATHLAIPKSNSPWDITSSDKFILKGVDISSLGKNCRKDLIEKYTKDLEIDMKVWMGFMGIYLAEGSYTASSRKNKVLKKNGYGIYVAQVIPDKKDKIKELLNQFPKDIVWSEEKRGFRVSDARLYAYLKPLGCCYDKYVPEELKNQSASMLEEMIDWFQLGDGRKINDRGYIVESIFSTSKRMMEDFQEIQLKIGGSGNIVETECKRDYVFAGRTIKKENVKTLYTLKFNKSNYVHIDNRFIKIEKIENFNDRVYCVKVPNQTLYVRDQGKCFWSGNSEVVELKNVCANLLKIDWQGDDVIGTFEVITTPNGNILKSLFESNIRVGVSTRALGSVNKNIRENADVVSDDLVIVAVDFVSNSSCQGAYMYPQAALNEGVISSKKSLNFNNKWVKTETIIREILGEIE